MATVVNKDGAGPGPEKHILTPNDLRSTETPQKVQPGVASANPNYIPPA
jgi:hypothetical protein